MILHLVKCDGVTLTTHKRHMNQWSDTQIMLIVACHMGLVGTIIKFQKYINSEIHRSMALIDTTHHLHLDIIILWKQIATCPGIKPLEHFFLYFSFNGALDYFQL